MESLVNDIPAGDGKTANLSLQCDGRDRNERVNKVFFFVTKMSCLFVGLFSVGGG
jgi:hypothetical protein